MRRPVRTIAARCAWAAILFVICFSGTLGAGDAIDADGGNILSSDEQELLEEYYQAARNGNYPAAWSCVERMFDPAEHSRTLRLLDHCRSDRDCPRADFIAWYSENRSPTCRSWIGFAQKGHRKMSADIGGIGTATSGRIWAKRVRPPHGWPMSWASCCLGQRKATCA